VEAIPMIRPSMNPMAFFLSPLLAALRALVGVEPVVFCHV
jgi:hypothetical protein